MMGSFLGSCPIVANDLAGIYLAANATMRFPRRRFLGNRAFKARWRGGSLLAHQRDHDTHKKTRPRRRCARGLIRRQFVTKGLVAEEEAEEVPRSGVGTLSRERPPRCIVLFNGRRRTPLPLNHNCFLLFRPDFWR